MFFIIYTSIIASIIAIRPDIVFPGGIALLFVLIAINFFIGYFYRKAEEK